MLLSLYSTIKFVCITLIFHVAGKHCSFSCMNVCVPTENCINPCNFVCVHVFYNQQQSLDTNQIIVFKAMRVHCMYVYIKMEIFSACLPCIITCKISLRIIHVYNIIIILSRCVQTKFLKLIFF